MQESPDLRVSADYEFQQEQNHQSIFITNAGQKPEEPSDPEQLKMYFFEQLTVLIERIDTHFVETLAAHEDDFIKAYKGQMLKIQKELRFLKSK